MITLRTLLRYSKNKNIFLITFVVYALTIVSLYLMIRFGRTIVFGDVNELEELDVSYFHVFFGNIILIYKTYILGLMTFGLYAFYSHFQNTVGIALVGKQLLYEGYEKLAYKMIPHGLIEFLGMSLALATVIWFWIKVIKDAPDIIKRKKNFMETVRTLVSTLLVSAIANTFIFAIAGIVEVLVSHIKVM